MMAYKYDYLLSFGEVYAGTTVEKVFPVTDLVQSKEWTVKQDSEIDSTLNVFTVKKSIVGGINQQEHKIIIKYSPFTPLQYNINFYTISNTGKDDIRLCVKGLCRSARVSVSIRKLCFYRLSNIRRTQMIFQLNNLSNVTVTFQIDIDNSQEIFVVNPVVGEIGPNSCAYITVLFLTKKKGSFYMDLPCLFMHHKPLYVELIGVNAENKNDLYVNVIHQQYSVNNTNGFERFTCDSFCANTICTFSNYPIDFGVYSALNFQELIRSEMINFSGNRLKIQWDLGNENSFAIQPGCCYIEAGEKERFNINFTPVPFPTLIGVTLYGRIFTYDTLSQPKPADEIMKVSDLMRLRIIANSAPRDNTWQPQIKIYPKIVVLPRCSESETVFSTFILRQMGMYPTLFKFIAPEDSNFRVYPMLGVINESYQICVVKFTPRHDNGTYNEKWQIQLNQMENSLLKIYFRAAVEKPAIIFGKNNTVKFGNVFPGCKKYVTSTITNLTQLSLQ